ncbi:hypothetical protein M2305_000221 [Gluconobacter cerinus]|nr:hypothetical protein [Gluconobacter cerinus]
MERGAGWPGRARIGLRFSGRDLDDTIAMCKGGPIKGQAYKTRILLEPSDIAIDIRHSAALEG